MTNLFVVSWAKNDKSTFLVGLNETQASFETNKEIVCENKDKFNIAPEKK